MERHWYKRKIIVAVGIMFVLDCVVWFAIWSTRPASLPEIYFLDVGQGDSEMIVLPGDVRILIDGGPPGKLMRSLSRVMPFFNRRIDLLILTHPQLDHFGGFIDVLKNYHVGMVLWNGREGEIAAYRDFTRLIEKKKVPTLVIGEGDKIKYKDAVIYILDPNEKAIKSKELNDTGIVTLLAVNGSKALFTADIGFNIEKELIAKYDIHANILKVGHHGSKYSSSDAFLNAVSPQVSFIEVGKNSYGHPTQQAMSRIESHGSELYRTDLYGTLKVILGSGKISVFGEKIPVVQ